MRKSDNDNIYAEGETVFAKVNPAVKLIIRRYVDRIYYCAIDNDASQEELVYFERELTSKSDITKKQ